MKKASLGLLLAALLCGSAHAFSTDFLDYSGMANFTSADWNLAKENAIKALETAKDNSKLSWSNPQTKASGYAIPSNTIHVPGATICRDLFVHNQAYKVIDEASYHFCKINGQWRVA